MIFLELFRSFGGDSFYEDTVGKFRAWSIYLTKDGREFLAVWKKIEFQENAVFEKKEQGDLQEIKEFALSSTQIKIIHRMVANYYTSYTNVVSLFLSPLQKISEFKPWKIPAKESGGVKLENGKLIFDWSIKSEGIQLCIFPDIRSISAWFGKSLPWSLLLHSQMTKKQRSTARQQIAQNKVSLIFATWSQIFFPRKYLKECFVFQPHKRYYKHQQDPRYETVDVLQKSAELYKFELTTRWA